MVERNALVQVDQDSAQQAFERALRLLQNKQEAFSPSAEGVEEQGATDGDAPDGQRPRSD